MWFEILLFMETTNIGTKKKKIVYFLYKFCSFDKNNRNN